MQCLPAHQIPVSPEELPLAGAILTRKVWEGWFHQADRWFWYFRSRKLSETLGKEVKIVPFEVLGMGRGADLL